MSVVHSTEVSRGERFEFGKNWSQFLSVLSEDRILQAEQSIREMLEVRDLTDKTFLDIGSGSGLFSLAARRLGARVHSIDFDPNSVSCTTELRRRHFPNSKEWVVQEASALDTGYIRSIGVFDIVYSWGVLHHTGKMWKGLENAQLAVAPRGRLFIAIYNDTGMQAARWKRIKKAFNSLPKILRTPFVLLTIAPAEMKGILRALAKLKPAEYLRSWTDYKSRRGMNRWSDLVDWVGGYPYEVAKPEEIFDFYRQRGFTLIKMKCGCVGLGCNEFVFERN